MTNQRRRHFIRNTAALAGASMLPPAVREVLAAPRASGTLGSIAHVVILCQENRSFDHYFGSMRGSRGFNDDHPATVQASNRTVFQQTDVIGQAYTPWQLNSATTAAQWLDDVLHDQLSGNIAWDNGRNDGWIIGKGMYAMSYFTRKDLPFHYALADAFTLCDNYFCSARTSTNPNRLFLMSGGIDPNGYNGGPIMGNDFTYGSLTWQTYPEALQNAGISWRVYQDKDNFDDNALAWFKQFTNLPNNSPLYVNGMQTRVLADFQNDVLNDRLPAVSWIVAPQAQSEHPAASPNVGADYVNQYLQALASNPKVWEKTVFILTYDENGGFYDHVTTPCAPPGTPDEYVGDASIGLGTRVPTIVCSPWSRGGWIASEVFDHTSILQFLETWTGVGCPNISQWRRAVCGNLLSCFDFSTSNAAFPYLPDTRALAAQANAQKSLPVPTPPGPNTRRPSYESGQKPQRTQPYQLNAWLTQDYANRQIWTNWSNGGTRSAPLQINLNNYRYDNPWLYTMAANASSGDFWHVIDNGGGYYDLEMIGPNQFYRRFQGYLNPLAWQGQFEPEVKLINAGPGRPLTVLLNNAGTRNTATFTILDRITTAARTSETISVAPGQSRTVSLVPTSGWYDLKVTLANDSRFMQSLVGCIEGQANSTRPPVLRT